MRRFAVFALLFLAGLAAKSQAVISFCAGVDPQTGYCVLNNDKFISSRDSTSQLLFIKIFQKGGFSTVKLNYTLNKLDTAGKETFFRSYEQPIQPNYDSYWQSDFLPSPGKYVVHLTDAGNKELAKKTVELLKYW